MVDQVFIDIPKCDWKFAERIFQERLSPHVLHQVLGKERIKGSPVFLHRYYEPTVSEIGIGNDWRTCCVCADELSPRILLAGFASHGNLASDRNRTEGHAHIQSSWDASSPCGIFSVETRRNV